MSDELARAEKQQEYFGKADKKINWTEIYNECVIDEAIAENKVKKLEKQIEKMKCCYNCKHSRTEYEHFKE